MSSMWRQKNISDLICGFSVETVVLCGLRSVQDQADSSSVLSDASSAWTSFPSFRICSYFLSKCLFGVCFLRLRVLCWMLDVGVRAVDTLLSSFLFLSFMKSQLDVWVTSYFYTKKSENIPLLSLGSQSFIGQSTFPLTLLPDIRTQDASLIRNPRTYPFHVSEETP